MEMFLLAYSATFTVQHLPLVVYNPNNDVQSREFIHKVENSGFFDVTMSAQSQEEVKNAIDEGKVEAGLIFPPNFEEKVKQGDSEVIVILDGTDSFSLQSAFSSMEFIAQEYSTRLMMQNLSASGAQISALSENTDLPITTYVQTLYNPTRDDMVIIVPGTAVMIIEIFAIVSIAMTIVHEREMGVAEQLLSTPIRPLENILGKIVPYIVLTLTEFLIVHLIGYFWFKVPFKGNVLLYLVLSLLYAIACLSLGLFISTIASTQKQIQMIASMLLLLSFLLSGLVFSRVPMPAWSKVIGLLLPVTHFIPIARGIIVKGVGIGALWGNVIALILFSLIQFLLLPVLTRKRLD
jgi:ABC-2 type transport system permease protein